MAILEAERICYSVDDAAAAMSVGRKTLYREIASGNLRPLKMGARTLISADELRAWVGRASKASGRGRR